MARPAITNTGSGGSWMLRVSPPGATMRACGPVLSRCLRRYSRCSAMPPPTVISNRARTLKSSSGSMKFAAMQGAESASAFSGRRVSRTISTQPGVCATSISRRSGRHPATFIGSPCGAATERCGWVNGLHSKDPWRCTILPAQTGLAQTIGIIDRLDGFVGNDGVLSHAAGALNKPGYLLLNARCADSRYEQSVHDTPWYPSLRVLRPDTMGDWDSVVANSPRQSETAARRGTAGFVS